MPQKFERGGTYGRKNSIVSIEQQERFTTSQVVVDLEMSVIQMFTRIILMNVILTKKQKTY